MNKTRLGSLRQGIFSGNTLKLFAAAAMLCDHVGKILLPSLTILQIVGRPAFPIFAFMIAEGCRHTRRRSVYFFSVFGLAVVFQIFYAFVSDSLYFSIFFTFSISILLIYALQALKRLTFDSAVSMGQKVFYFLLFIAFLVFVAVLNSYFRIDYGFAGCLAPLFAALPHSVENTPSHLRRCDTLSASLICFTLPLLCLAFVGGKPIQFFSLLALPLLMLYNRKRGCAGLKYFFYAFYPTHLVILYGIKMLIENIR